MSRKTKYTIGLAVSLIFFFTVGNIIRDMPNTVSTFPHLFSVLPIPILLYLLLNKKIKSEVNFTIKDSFFWAEGVVRNAAFLFAVFALIYSLFYFGDHSIFISLITFVMAIVATWVVGVIFTLICTWIIKKRYTQKKFHKHL